MFALFVMKALKSWCKWLVKAWIHLFITVYFENQMTFQSTWKIIMLHHLKFSSIKIAVEISQILSESKHPLILKLGRGTFVTNLCLKQALFD